MKDIPPHITNIAHLMTVIRRASTVPLRGMTDIGRLMTDIPPRMTVTRRGATIPLGGMTDIMFIMPNQHIIFTTFQLPLS